MMVMVKPLKPLRWWYSTYSGAGVAAWRRMPS